MKLANQTRKYDSTDKFLATELNNLYNLTKTLSQINKTDMALTLEDVVIPIFNIIYDTKFENVNKWEQNFMGIDLYSKEKEIAIQVTIDDTPQKIRKTLFKVERLIRSNTIEIKELFIFVLTNKTFRAEFNETNYFSKDNIITIPRLLKQDIIIKEKIKDFIETLYKMNFSAKTLKYKNIINEVFVETEVYKRAKNTLEKNHAVILNGNAGVGKTITSYKLFFEYIGKGYIPIKSLDDIKNSLGNNKYIMFIDDAITSNNILNAEWESVHERFSSIIMTNEDFKVILNSRTKILKSYDEYESRFGLSNYKNYFINADYLTKIEKFKILKKHISHYDASIKIGHVKSREFMIR